MPKVIAPQLKIWAAAPEPKIPPHPARNRLFQQYPPYADVGDGA
jgi:hypothetical protein